MPRGSVVGQVFQLGKGTSAFPHHFRLERYVFKVLKYARITSIYSALVLVQGKPNPFLGREEASDQLYQISCNPMAFCIPAPAKLTIEPAVRLKAFLSCYLGKFLSRKLLQSLVLVCSPTVSPTVFF